MPTRIESREYEQSVWQEVTWSFLGQRLRFGFSLLEAPTERLRIIRVAVPVPNDAIVSNVLQQVEVVHRDPENPSYMPSTETIQAHVVSYWSPGLRVGEKFVIPCELAEPLDNKGPIHIQILKVDTCGYDLNHRPAFNNLV